MRDSRLNEWLQIAASAGVIVSLLFVAYEVRQSNLYAAAEAARSNFSGWEEISISGYETDIAEVVVKAVDEPERLSEVEKFKLGWWLTAILNQYERALKMSDLGLGEDQGEDLTQWAQYYFESDYAKEWLQENEPWMDPRTVAAIKRGLELKPEDANPIP